MTQTHFHPGGAGRHPQKELAGTGEEQAGASGATGNDYVTGALAVTHPGRMRRATEDAAIITIQQALESELKQ